MRQETINIYQFEELSDKAKEKAVQWFSQGNAYFFIEDSLDSIETFCKAFGVKLKDYEVDSWRYSFKTDATNDSFRGLKLSDVKRDATLTGYYTDYTLSETFYDTFKATGDAKQAFNDALDKAFYEIQKEMEYQDSTEYAIQMIVANEYEFTADGSIY